MPDIDLEAMLEAYRRGLSIGVVAEAAGLSYTWTRRLLLENGAQLRKRPARECPVPVEQLAAEYRAGASIKTLADRHGLYYKRIRNLLLDHGVTLRPSTRAHLAGDS